MYHFVSMLCACLKFMDSGAVSAHPMSPFHFFERESALKNLAICPAKKAAKDPTGTLLVTFSTNIPEGAMPGATRSRSTKRKANGQSFCLPRRHDRKTHHL